MSVSAATASAMASANTFAQASAFASAAKSAAKAAAMASPNPFVVAVGTWAKMSHAEGLSQHGYGAVVAFCCDFGPDDDDDDDDDDNDDDDEEEDGGDDSDADDDDDDDDDDVAFSRAIIARHCQQFPKSNHHNIVVLVKVNIM